MDIGEILLVLLVAAVLFISGLLMGSSAGTELEQERIERQCLLGNEIVLNSTEFTCERVVPNANN